MSSRLGVCVQCGTLDTNTLCDKCGLPTCIKCNVIDGMEIKHYTCLTKGQKESPKYSKRTAKYREMKENESKNARRR